MGVPCIPRTGAGGGGGGGAEGGGGGGEAMAAGAMPLNALIPAPRLPGVRTVLDLNVPKVNAAQLTLIFQEVFTNLLAIGHVHHRRAIPLLCVL